jgi:hypothetical protein
MAQWLYLDEPKRVSGALRVSDCAETASNVAGACCLITLDAMMTWCYPANRPVLPGSEPSDLASDGDRLVCAVGMLQEGPAEWHVFALTEIAVLSRRGNWLASVGLRLGRGN